MALIKCRECGAEVSSSAKNCMKCGTKEFNGMSFDSLLQRAMLGFTAVVMILVWISSGDRSPQNSEPIADVTVTQPAPDATTKKQSPKVSAKKDDWWSIFNHECIHSDRTPDAYTKAFPCKILERQRAKGLVFVKCNFETATPGQPADFYTIFANSRERCENALEQMRALEASGY